MAYVPKHISNPAITQHLSDCDAMLFNQGKRLRRPDVMPKYNPRHLPVPQLTVEYEHLMGHVIGLSVYYDISEREWRRVAYYPRYTYKFG